MINIQIIRCGFRFMLIIRLTAIPAGGLAVLAGAALVYITKSKGKRLHGSHSLDRGHHYEESYIY